MKGKANMRKPNRKTVRAAIRASVPEGKLKEARIVLSDAPRGTEVIGGFTEYDPRKNSRVIKLGAPAGDKAFDITVRGHETRHATRHKAARNKPMTPNEAIASQIVDDVNIECSPLPDTKGLRAYRRAHLATAFDGLKTIARNARKVKNGLAPDNVAMRNAQLVHSVRTAAMLIAYGQGGEAEKLARIRGGAILRKAIGDKTRKAIVGVIEVARSRRHRNRAISMLVSLMESEPSEDEEERERVPGEKSNILAPVSEGDALDGKMKIIDLRPKSVFCSKEKSITRRHAPDGVCINPARFVNAIVSGNSHGLFSRRVRQKPGGTVVIDASGSMGADKANLSAICKLVPSATVAFYSGTVSGKGELVVYAYQGKRFAGELPEEHMHGGNAVDLPAVKWMMRLPKPWTLISDLQFCGGVLGSESVALALVERATKRGDLTVHHSLDAAYEAFGGKGNLHDAEYRRSAR
jgi:hypothetical protein